MKSILSFLTNKYFLATGLFLSWIFFFSSNDVLTQYKQNKEYKEIQNKLKFLETEIVRMKEVTTAMQKDSAVIEKYARENYRMKKENEDVYVYDTLVTSAATNKK